AFLQALSMNVNDSLTRQKYAKQHVCFQRFDAAVAEVESAQELDPRTAGPYIMAAIIFSCRREFKRAVEAADHAIAVAPSNPPAPPAQYQRGLALARLGDLDGALPTMLGALGTSDRPPAPLAGLVYIHAQRGERAEADRLLRELERRCGDDDSDPFSVADACA